MNAETELRNLERFVKFASRGGPGASHGEQICRKLAKALEGIGDDMALLDTDTLEGFCTLVRYTSGPWPTEQSKETVFRFVRRAAGRKS